MDKIKWSGAIVLGVFLTFAWLLIRRFAYDAPFYVSFPINTVIFWAYFYACHYFTKKDIK